MDRETAILEGQSAERFLEQAAGYFDLLRSLYQKEITFCFENHGPETQTRVEQIGAKLAVLRDLEQNLTGLVIDKDAALREKEEES